MSSVSSEKFDTNESKIARQNYISHDQISKTQHVHGKNPSRITPKITQEIIRELKCK